MKAAEEGFSKGGYKGMLEGTLKSQNRFYAQGTLPVYSLALTNARLGNKQDTLRYLEIALNNREGDLLSLANEPAFDFLHDDPEYMGVVRRAKSSPKPTPSSMHPVSQKQ